MNTVTRVDDRWQFGIRIDGHEFRFVLFSPASVDGKRLILDPSFFQKKSNLGRIGRAAVIKFQRVGSFFCHAAVGGIEYMAKVYAGIPR